MTSLVDLARAAGISPSTVSRALSGSSVVSAKTRELVQALAREHNFQLNHSARNLRLKRTHAIAVVLPLGHEVGQHLSDPFFLTILGQLADALTERGYDLLLSRVIPTDRGWLARLVDSGRVDGIIVIGQSDQAAALDEVAARFPALVVWGALAAGQVHCSVGSDNRLGGALAAEHLLALGHRRLAFFGPAALPEIEERRLGVVDAVERVRGATLDSASVALTADAAFDTIAHYLGYNPLPDAVVCASDTVAMMAIRALAERGLRVPDDVAVTGFDDVPLAAHTTPPLTTVRQDVTRGAALIVELLMRKLAGEAVDPVVLPPTLVVRGSTAERRVG